jgi:hypothetical protein
MAAPLLVFASSLPDFLSKPMTQWSAAQREANLHIKVAEARSWSQKHLEKFSVFEEFPCLKKRKIFFRNLGPQKQFPLEKCLWWYWFFVKSGDTSHHPSGC